VGRFEEVQGEILFADEMFIERRVGVPARFRDVADRRGRDAVLTEQFHRRPQDRSLCRRVAVANVERQHGLMLATANQGVKRACEQPADRADARSRA
jgi:hypothetical protein